MKPIRVAWGVAVAALALVSCSNGEPYVDDSPVRALPEPLEVTYVSDEVAVDDLAVDPLTGDYLVLSNGTSGAVPTVARVARETGTVTETVAVPAWVGLAPDPEWTTGGGGAPAGLGVTRAGMLLLSDGDTNHELRDPGTGRWIPVKGLLAGTDHAPYSFSTVADDLDPAAPAAGFVSPSSGGDEVVTMEKYPCPGGTIDFWSGKNPDDLSLVRSVPAPEALYYVGKAALAADRGLLFVLGYDSVHALDARTGTVLFRMHIPWATENDELAPRMAYDSTTGRLVLSRPAPWGTVLASYAL